MPTQLLCEFQHYLVQHELHTSDCFQCTHDHNKQAAKEPKYIGTISCFAKCFLKIKIKHTVTQLTKETAMIRSLITRTLR